MATVAFTVNNSPRQIDAERDKPLVWVLREELGLTGTKFSCGVGLCGACTVHLDGAPVRACIATFGDAEGASVTTIEGLSEAGGAPLQRAWVAEQVVQCGYCQPGMLMQAAGLLARNPAPSRAEIVDHMDGNICRCGTYQWIIRAIERAARESGHGG